MSLSYNSVGIFGFSEGPNDTFSAIAAVVSAYRRRVGRNQEASLCTLRR